METKELLEKGIILIGFYCVAICMATVAAFATNFTELTKLSKIKDLDSKQKVKIKLHKRKCIMSVVLLCCTGVMYYLSNYIFPTADEIIFMLIFQILYLGIMCVVAKELYN